MLFNTIVFQRKLKYVIVSYMRQRAIFTNGLCQHKLSFGIKIVLRSEELALKMYGQLFLCLTLLNMHL